MSWRLIYVDGNQSCEIGRHHHTISVHRRYQRHLTDLAWRTRAVRIHLTVWKFRCRNGACGHQIFTERLPDLVAAYGRHTHRWATALRTIGLSLGGDGGARLAADARHAPGGSARPTCAPKGSRPGRCRSSWWARPPSGHARPRCMWTSCARSGRVSRGRMSHLWQGGAWSTSWTYPAGR
jgi:hypothetical protein